MRSLLKTLVPLALFVSVGCAGGLGCSTASSEEADEGDAALAAADALETEIALLGGSADDVNTLVAQIDERIAGLEAKKKDAKAQAKKDVEGYTPDQWKRSFFRHDEMAAAIDARADDIFDRPARRALDGAKAQRALADEVAKLVASGAAGTLAEPAPRAAYARVGYIEVAIAIKLNDELGFGGQMGARIEHLLQKKLPWLGKIFKGLKRDHRAAGIEGEAINIDRGGAQDYLWKKDPVGSTAWHPRSAAEITPKNLFRGPWYNGTATPRLPKPDEVWKLAGFRSQTSDGSHPSIDIANGDAEVKLKFRRQNDVFEEGPNPRIMWALGYETDPNYIFKEVRIEPRVMVASSTSLERLGLKFGPADDEIIPARPPKGFSIPLNPMKVAPGPENISVHFIDGHDESGTAAVDSLKRAANDRAVMDSMEYVTVRHVFGETDPPNKRDGVGPWDFDANNHVDNREIRAIGILLGAWLGNSDVKFNNVRLDIDRPKDGQATYFHTLSDVGHLDKNFGFTAGVNPTGEFLHPDTNVATIRAFDRITANDAKWAISKLASLTEEQIVACVAAGAFTDEGLAIHAEKLIGRRDDLIKTFKLEGEFALMRPNGPNPNPPARHYDEE